MFEKLNFRLPFRKYQRMILDEVVTRQTDNKYHIVAPPGAGKTIIGLELVRRFDAPAVVFAPTTTIQAQWYQQLGLFVESPADLKGFASMDPRRPAPIHILTYQVISTQSQAQQHLREGALLLWQEELMLEGQAGDAETAAARLETIRANNPDAYRRELQHYTNRLKHRLLSEPGADVARFLHPNALRLIDDLVAGGVRTVVLDECHHLLDYWAIVLRYLISRIDSPRVVRLTATLPSPDDDAEFENYDSLLSEVDFEIPTPAVVKEGDLAPYRDLVYFVKPMKREMDYLDRIQAEFEAVISGLTQLPRFVDWVKGLVVIPPETPQPEALWQARWEEQPLLTLAAVRFLNANGYRPDPKLVTPVEALDPPDLEDWSNLLERFGLDVLKTSSDPADHELFQALRKAILPFGLTLTERGMSQSRSPGDLVLTFSEAKDFAVAHILGVESRAMGDRLRAIVVTDYEQLGTGLRLLKGVLAADAGSAVRLFHCLAARPGLALLCPTLVTGQRLMVPAAAGERLLACFSAYLKSHSLEATCSLKPGRVPGVVEVVGEGKDWASRTYVRMVTAAFEAGEIKCLVGTRGIFGEGWDSLSLNTLIDLTSVTTATSVQQLRGRTIRLDPNWPRKVAHNWDVVCMAGKFKRGRVDFDRFVRRHQQTWGLVVTSDWADALQDAAQVAVRGRSAEDNLPQPGASRQDEYNGRIVKGILHVNPGLVGQLYVKPWNKINLGVLNRSMIRQVTRRDRIYDLWGIGQEYSNFAYSVTSVYARDLKIRTAYTLQATLRALLRRVQASVIASVFSIFFYFCRGLSVVSGSTKALVHFFMIAAAVSVVLGLLFNLKGILQLLKRLLTEQAPDAILLDVGRALLAALRSAGLVSRNLNVDFVRVIWQADDSYEVLLDYASPEDSAVFIQAYNEIFEPVRDQRYLIQRTEDRLPSLPLRALWLPLRVWTRKTGMYPSAYHPVPKILAMKKERVEYFARAWAKYVGGGEIVFTRSEIGRAVLFSARAQRRPSVKQMAFETWK